MNKKYNSIFTNNNNNALTILSLIDDSYLKSQIKEEPKHKLKIHLYKIKDLTELLYLLEEYKDTEDYQALVNYWLYKYYNSVCSNFVEEKLCKFSYIKDIRYRFNEYDVSLKLDNEIIKFDIKLTVLPEGFNINDDNFVNINDIKNTNVKDSLTKELYRQNNKEENRIYFIIKSKSNNKLDKLRGKANFDLLNEVIDKYFSDKKELEKLIFNYNKRYVIMIPILID